MKRIQLYNYFNFRFLHYLSLIKIFYLLTYLFIYFLINYLINYLIYSQ